MKKDKGFTLCELIAVLAILTVVVSIVAPKIFKTISNNKRIVCLLNRDQIVKNYRLQKILTPNLSFETYYKNINDYFTKEVSCPHGYDFTFSDNKLICPVHGAVYLSVTNEEYIYYNFFDSSFNQSLIENIIFHELDDWDFTHHNGNVFYTNNSVGQNRFFLENSLESYKITSNVILSGENGYGIFFDSVTDNDAKDDGYIFQFDYGYDNGMFIFRKRTNGHEHAPFIKIDPLDVYESFDENSYWNTEHKVEVEVLKISDTEKRVKVYIDNKEITENKVVVINTLNSNVKYFGFRTWGSSRVYIRDIRIDRLY
ncbi:type II secretion system protein [Clostridium sp. 'deep sea']|uniref:type II secretion system protein n=1 Tax=Clostridium sp. 'deep sea' TaxID=2779445 RepID=UPI0018965FF3|nr:type II secretion system protein [Clostridium sp. 'deep sea']QOR36262.1 type II secretion system protein [Clostridium sp. 'deep sea']